MDTSWLLMLSSGNVPSVEHENSTWVMPNLQCEFVQPSLPAIEGALGLAVHCGHVRVSRLDCLSGNLEILVHGIRFQALCCLQTHVHPILTSEMDSRWIQVTHEPDTQSQLHHAYFFPKDLLTSIPMLCFFTLQPQVFVPFHGFLL